MLSARARDAFLRKLRPAGDYLLSGPIEGRAKYADCFVIAGAPTPELEAQLKEHPMVRSGTGRLVVLPWASADGVLTAMSKK
jgi:hypothetical protein